MEQPTAQATVSPSGQKFKVLKLLILGLIFSAIFLILFFLVYNNRASILNKFRSISEQALIRETQKAGLINQNFQSWVIDKKPQDPGKHESTASPKTVPASVSNYDYYLDQFLHIVGRYNSDPSAEKLKLARKWEQLIKQKFPKDYEETKNQNGFEIVER